MRFPIDVAYVGADGTVLKTRHMGRYRVGAPVRRASWIIEAEAGAFARWGLREGTPVEVRTTDAADGGAGGAGGAGDRDSRDQGVAASDA
jgi:uncharacterized membrane protein (UPF0127 family)